jgi:hypothetical protein
VSEELKGYETSCLGGSWPIADTPILPTGKSDLSWESFIYTSLSGQQAGGTGMTRKKLVDY